MLDEDASMDEQEQLWRREHGLSIVLSFAEQQRDMRVRTLRRQWAIDNPCRVLWHSAKANAMQRGLEFTIEVEHIVIPERCPFLRHTLITGKRRPYEPYAPSLDRIDSLKGYTPDNIQVISRKANTMKNDATKEELVVFAINVLRHYAPQWLKD